jgi:hypothetical protein
MSHESLNNPRSLLPDLSTATERGSVPLILGVSTSRTERHCPFLRPRNAFNLASFNVRTLKQIGQQAALARTLEGLDVDVCCLSETRLYDSSQVLPLRSPSNCNSIFYARFSGDPEAASVGVAGVGIALSKRAEGAILDWIPVNSRLCAVRISGSSKVNAYRDTKRCLFVVSAYAPTDCSPDSVKDQFYAALDSLLRRAAGTDIIVLAGDLNARIGRLTSDETHLGGMHGLEITRNDNGDRLLTLCTDHRLFLASSNFRHRKRQLATWRPPSALQRWTQIDHVAISHRWRGSVQDCRSYWNTCLESDHALVCAKLCMRFCGKKTNKVTKIDVARLTQSTVLESFQRDLVIQLPSQASSSVDQHWSSIRSALHEAGINSCGPSNRASQPWVSGYSLQIMDLRRTIPPDHNQKQKRQLIRHQLCRSLKNDREIWWNRQANEMESAWATGDSRRLFQLIRSVGTGKATVSETICEIDGTPITNLLRRMHRWVEHFQSQFNWPNTVTSTPQPVEVTPWSVPTFAPTEEEIREATRSLKNFKSPGEDELPAELFKSGGPALFRQLTELFGVIWTQERVPAAWSRSIVVPIFKKGSRTGCCNHRGISLTPIVSKLFAIVILRRLSASRELTYREEQAGFRSGRGCVDQIFTLRQILEQRHAHQRPSIVVFLDIRAAFDSIDRTTLWNCLTKNGVPNKFVNMLKALYDGTSGNVRVYKQLSASFPIASGVRQGCPISPFLFNFAIDDILGAALSRVENGGVDLLPGRRVQDLDYADDIVVCGEDTKAVQATLDSLVTEVNRYGMQFSSVKCKVLLQDWTAATPSLTLMNEPLEFVNQFTYLGSIISAGGDITSEVSSRISKARMAFAGLRHLWRRRDLSLRLKGRVYNASVRAVLLYGCESWPLRVSDIRRLTSFDHRCLRSISRVWWQQRVSNAELRRRVFGDTHNKELGYVIEFHRLRWLGHVLRMEEQRLPKRALFALPDGSWKKRRGGQSLTWMRNMKDRTSRLASVGSVRLPGWGPKESQCLWLETLMDMAQDRTQWRSCCSFLLS